MTPARPLETLIMTVRGQKVLLDADLANLYGVSTKRFNEQVKRNIERFPEDFRFQLTAGEKSEVVANCDHLARLKFSRTRPCAFTDHGALMAANVLISLQVKWGARASSPSFSASCRKPRTPTAQPPIL